MIFVLSCLSLFISVVILGFNVKLYRGQHSVKSHCIFGMFLSLSLLLWWFLVVNFVPSCEGLLILMLERSLSASICRHLPSRLCFVLLVFGLLPGYVFSSLSFLFVPLLLSVRLHSLLFRFLYPFPGLDQAHFPGFKYFLYSFLLLFCLPTSIFRFKLCCCCRCSGCTSWNWA